MGLGEGTRWKMRIVAALVFALGLAEGQEAAVREVATCEASSAEFCVRSCCAEGQNVKKRACADSDISWVPSFLNHSAVQQLEIVSGNIGPCAYGMERKVLSSHLDSTVVYDLSPSGELDVLTSTKNYSFGHDYCFWNVEGGDALYESVRGCTQIQVPQVPSLVSIDDVAAVSFSKCCRTGQVLGVSDREYVCVDYATEWQPWVIHGSPTQLMRLPKGKGNITADEKFECPADTTKQPLLSSIHSDAFFLEANGQLLLSHYNLSLPAGQFCLDSFHSGPSLQPIAMACYSNGEEHTKEEIEGFCPDGLCVQKCCGPNYHLYNNSCHPTNFIWNPTFYNGEELVEEELDHNIVHGRAKCGEWDSTFVFSRRLSDEDAPLVQINGEIHLPKLNLSFKPHQCCIDQERYLDGSFESYEDMAVCCYPFDYEAYIRNIVYNTLLVISCIFLFVMIAIYMLVPKLRSIHGKCLMSHATALFVAFSLTVLNQLVGVNLGASCDTLGMLLYFSFLAALFWLNVMSFDIWWTFAHLRTQPPSERSLRNRFIRHSLYAWGVPLLMTGLLAFFNYVPYDVIPEGAIVRPALGKRKCFLSGPKKELYYFYIPIFVVTGVNILFFIATARSLYKAEKSSRILNRKRTAKDRLKVYVNLFIIMEVSWIAECLSTQIGPIQAWYFSDVINASQGTLIFILFISRSSTRETIKERFTELTKYTLNQATRRVHPTDRNEDAAGRTSYPTKSTNTNTSSNSSGARKSVEGGEGIPMKTITGPAAEAQATANGAGGGGEAQPNGGAGGSAEGAGADEGGGLDPAPKDSLC